MSASPHDKLKHLDEDPVKSLERAKSEDEEKLLDQILISELESTPDNTQQSNIDPTNPPTKDPTINTSDVATNTTADAGKVTSNVPTDTSAKVSSIAPVTKPKSSDKKDKKQLHFGGKDNWSYKQDTELHDVDGIMYHFAKEKSQRKIYISMKVKRFSDIDNVKETFRCRYHIYATYLISWRDFKAYQREKALKKLRRWEPSFAPRFEFINSVHKNAESLADYPPFGSYRILQFPDMLGKEYTGIDPRRALFIRVRYNYDLTFSEQLELHNFPLDCQDFTIVFREDHNQDRVLLLPEPRYRISSAGTSTRSKFFAVDPTYSVLDEWEFYSSHIEFAPSSSSASRSSSVYSQVTIRFKMRRKWSVYFWNIIFFYMVITALSLSCFTLDEDHHGERINLAITILLTQVALQYVNFNKMPNIPYLTFLHRYVITCFMFVCCVTIESSIFEMLNIKVHLGSYEFDLWMANVFNVLWIAYHLSFLTWGFYVRYQETRKLLMDTDEIADKVEESVTQFMMSWKPFYYLLYPDKDLETTTDGKKRKTKSRQDMRITDALVSFASYARKENLAEIHSCGGYVGYGCATVGRYIRYALCCVCCRQSRLSRDIQQTKANYKSRRYTLFRNPTIRAQFKAMDLETLGRRPTSLSVERRP